jgi:cytochrome c biogenesis protein CcmG, thiol:disulfide interchange protein DsbE
MLDSGGACGDQTGDVARGAKSMKNRLKLAIAAVLLGASATPLGAAMSRDAPVIGQPAPDFQLTLMDGSHVRLSELRGQVVVLNFWATWCVPCRVELPLLDRYYRLRRDAGLRVFAVTTEGSVPLYRLHALFAAMAIPAVRSMRGPYDTMGGLPTNFVIDRAGRVRYASSGAFDLPRLNEVLIPLLNEPAP